jgi:hypothetical protein
VRLGRIPFRVSAASVNWGTQQAFQHAFGLDLGVPALDGYQHEQPNADLGDRRVRGLDARLGYALQEAYHRLAPIIRRSLVESC